ncbi:hypothetical protein [Amycolatopsis sp. Hca4]|uniref:hypothetical protein n=1 Tax=Amycolatopsis sp. Hca4 TaxID=2742131 RepID=UPI001592747A|nr:hypothetical protein [Amycolatopsis sp. Hca4]QKV76332.1 hypothetical protein HUT10_23005 [Amycolatopsis sp. Hca4]
MDEYLIDPRAYVWLPPRLTAKPKRTLPLLGGFTTVVALAMCVAVPVLGYTLPTSHKAANDIPVMFGLFSAVMLLMSGIALLFAPAWVEVGHYPGGTGHILRLRPASVSVGPLCGGAVSIVGWPLFYLFYATPLTWSDPGPVNPHGFVQITFGIFVLLVIPVIAVVLGVVDLIVGLPALRPSPQTLQRYAR